MNSTKIFDRLPSDAGVTFEGFEEIRIKSRESVRNKLEEFMEYCKNAKKPAIRVILGEWGEGKTDAYRRYVQQKSQAEGNYAFFVSASTLSNGYEVPNIRKLLETTSLSAVRFLVVLFSCVREESKETKIPGVEKYKDSYAYLNDVLANLVGEKKTRRIFIFIDEFEELLLNPPRLNDIISGIKETINGRFTSIDENGEYAGCTHLIIAATPDAFYRLQVDEETSLIFGGLGRRAAVIDLPQIRKQEGMEFLYALLKYSYKNNLPQPLPFDNLGIFHALFRITQGNPGNLVSLFTRLMNSARIDHNQIKIIDGEHLLKFLEREQVFVYGGTTACLETEAFFRILKVVEEQRVKEIGQKCGVLLKTLCGELKPFSTEELESRFGRDDIKNLISIINNDLKSREGIERAILKVSPLREGKSFQDILEVFKEYITMERGRKYIKIDNYSEPLEDFEDRITWFSINGDKIIPQIYLPSEKYSLMSFLEGITSERALDIERLVNRKLCKDEYYYLASDELLSQIFPTPVPRELEFIKNRELRMKLWREVTRNLAEQYEIYMPTAFMNLLEMSKLFELREIERRVLKSPARFAELIIDGIKVNSLFYSINGDVKGSDVEELNRLIRGTKPPIHCVVLLYTGEMTQEAEDKIINKELGKEGENIILDIHLHPTLAKRIISIHKASFQQEELNESLFLSAIKKIVTQELDFQNKVKDWLNSQEKKGVVIIDLSIEATSNLREFADALKFYINFMGEEHTAREIFNKNRNELLRFIKYEAKKISIIPDIELPKFIRLSEDLKNNGFLSSSKDRYLLQFHPVEKRILAILKKETELLESDLANYFIVKSPRFLKDVFLPTLEYKGLIKRKGNSYLLNDKRQLFAEVKLEFQKFKQLSEMEKYHDYGYVFMTKERDYRFITLREFETLVENLYQKTQEMVGLNDEVALQKLSLLKRLLQHFMEEFLPLFNGASSKAEDVIIDVRRLHSNLKESLDQVRVECDKWLKLKFSVENISEYRDVKRISESVEEYIKYGYDEVMKVVNEEFVKSDDALNAFFFRKSDEEAFYFNPKLYLISTRKSQLDQIFTRIDKIVKEELNNKFRTLDQRQDQVELKIREKVVPEKNRVSNLLLGILEKLVKNILPDLQPAIFETISLTDIREYVLREIPSINSNLDTISSCLTFFDKVVASESSFLAVLEESKKLSEHILFIFDVKEYDVIAKNFNSILNSVESEEYNKISGDLTLQDAQTLSQKMENLKQMFDELTKQVKDEKSSIDKAWSKYSRDSIEYLDNTEYILRLLEKRYGINIGEVVTELRKIRESISVGQILNLKLRLSEIEHMKTQLRQYFYEVIKPVLKEKELQLLELLVKKTRLEGKEWWSNQELYQIAKNELGIQSEETEEILQKLIEQGLFRRGVSLSF